MARTPRATVSKTSGQGVSRLSYQQAYRMKHDADTPTVKGPGTTAPGGDRNYAKKGKSDGGAKSSFNVSYGNTLVPTDIDELGGMFKDKPAKPSANFGPGNAKRMR